MDALKIATSLVSFPSVSHLSNERISRYVADYLRKLNFETEWLSYRNPQGESKVNLVAKRGRGQGGVAYLSHTDVVPADDWNVPFCGPFTPAVHEGRLYGRGSCDMKSSLACALAAIARIPENEQESPIYVVCTADEELGTIGARQVDQESQFFQEMVASEVLGIVGEPTMLEVVNGHKGGVGITISSKGKSAHSSLATGINANHALIPILPLLLEIQQECETNPNYQSSVFDPPTLSWNMIIRNVPEAINVTPSLAQACIFFRPMPNVDHQPLVDRVEKRSRELGLEFEFVDKTPPLFVSPTAPCVKFFNALTGNTLPRTVCYATDGGVLQRLKNLVVCGPGNIAQAHRNDEWISLEQLKLGTDLYERAFRHWEYWKQNGKLPSLEAPSVETGSTWVEPEVRVRPATPEDLESIEAFLQVFVEQNKVLKRSRAELATLITNGFIAVADKEIVGFCAIEIYSRKLGEIQCLAVDQLHQGKGVGSSLVKACVERGKEKGILEVMAISSSEGFLRKLGFDYSLPDQKRALFCQLRSREEMYHSGKND